MDGMAPHVDIWEYLGRLVSSLSLLIITSCWKVYVTTHCIPYPAVSVSPERQCAVASLARIFPELNCPAAEDLHPRGLTLAKLVISAVANLLFTSILVTLSFFSEQTVLRLLVNLMS